jgi:lysophospholipase L1-like esterase
VEDVPVNVRRFVVIMLLAVTGCASAPERGELTYLALGASDAVGIGATPLRNGYVFLVRDGLRDDGHDVMLVNFGIPGAEIGAIERLARLAPGVQPGLVTLWTGANDLIAGNEPAAFEGTLATLLEGLRDATDAIIVIGDLPDLTRLPRFLERPDPDVTSARVRAFNDAIERQATEFEVPIARLSEVRMLDELTSDIDGFHPNDEGHRMLADQFLRQARAALAGP